MEKGAMMMTTQTATPTKLRTGAWGAKVAGAVQAGDTVTITTKAGKSWTATVSRVVWTNGEVSICATESRPAPSRARRYCCDECDEWVTRGDGSSCWETGLAH